MTGDDPNARGDMPHELPRDIPRHLSPDRTMEDVRLPARIRWPLLALLVTIFLFAGKAPIWRDPFDIDRAVWLSYAPIPLLVGAGLWWSKRLSTLTVFLNTLEIVITKFTLTYTIAMVLWVLIPPRPSEASPAVAQPPAPVDTFEEPPEPTPWPDDDRGSVTGVVNNPSGTPIPDVFVYVSSGLDDIVFERPTDPHFLDLNEKGFPATLTIARRWQRLLGRSTNGILHTLFLEGSDRSTRAVPLLPSGAPTTLSLGEARGIVPIRCIVHRKRAHLAVLHHPYYTRTNSRGQYVLKHIPAREITLAAWTLVAQTEAEATLKAGASATVDLALSR